MSNLEKLYNIYEKTFGSFELGLNYKEIQIWNLGFAKPSKPARKWYVLDWILYRFLVSSWEYRVSSTLFFAEFKAKSNISSLLVDTNAINRILGRLLYLHYGLA